MVFRDALKQNTRKAYVRDDLPVFWEARVSFVDMKSNRRGLTPAPYVVDLISVP